ncbi:MAG: ferredoxin [Acidobacteria bacterium]|nr:MAG: ferredoxin [Acidobacteriota bacterium]
MKIKVNGLDKEVEKDQTILEALQSVGIEVPTLCHIKGLFPSGACRMCIVEVEGFPNLIPSCAYPISEGMVIETHSPRAVQARKMIIELLLSNHPDDCLYCVRNKNCHLQDLAADYGVRERVFSQPKPTHDMDVSSPALIRDQAKCILCGKCVRVCEEVMGVSAIDFVHRGSKTIIAPAFEEGMNMSSCINCGQCIVVCPTGALREQSHTDRVLRALMDPDIHVVAQHAPAISVTLAEEWGLKTDADATGILNATLRKLGFDSVFDTGYTADLTIMEEASELVHRIQNNGVLPMMTTCSPAWVKYMEQLYSDLLPHLSSCKSPHQMMGALTKTVYAEREGLDPDKMFVVSIMPCTAKKFEADRAEMRVDNRQDVDAVLTTRELLRMVNTFGLDVSTLSPAEADCPFGERSSAGKLFGATGGVMEAAVRSAQYFITGEDPEEWDVVAVRGLENMKAVTLKVGDLEVNVAVVNGVGSAKAVLDEIREGKSNFHFVEVMSCPGGCIGGGGQPLVTNPERIKARMKSLYQMDSKEAIRASHRNPAIQELYDTFLGEPLSHKSHELLHTQYESRAVMV